MKTVRMTLDPGAASAKKRGSIDAARVDATTEKDIAAQMAADEADARQ